MYALDYPEPVDKLLTYGKPELSEAEDWPNYLELGFTPEHIPDPDYFRSKPPGERKASRKTKNKMAKLSRKKNRKRK